MIRHKMVPSREEWHGREEGGNFITQGVCLNFNGVAEVVSHFLFEYSMVRCHNFLAVGQAGSFYDTQTKQIFLVRCFYFIDSLCQCHSFQDWC